MSDPQNSKSFKVNDRRRFDNEGNDRDNEVSAPAATSKVKEAVMVGEPHEPRSNPELADAHGLTFSGFLMSLATQAMMQLGEIPPPEGMQLPKDPDGARQTIDIIAMLEAKTKGNLDADEQKLMREAMHTLRLAFVKATKI